MAYKHFKPGQYQECEARDYRCFKEFRDASPIAATLFTDYYPTGVGDTFDIQAFNITGGTSNVELKMRREDAENFNDCWIERGKYERLMERWNEGGYFPIYINFIGGASNIYMWLLPEVGRKNIHRNVTVTSQDGTSYTEDKYGLLWKDAYHFVEGELVAAPEMMTRNKRKAVKTDWTPQEIENIRITNETYLGIENN